MEDNHTILTEKIEVFPVQHGMENKEIMLIEKLDFPGILKKSLQISYRCPQFILLTFLTSLPLIITMILHEIILQATMFETKSILFPQSSDDSNHYSHIYALYDLELDTILMLLKKVFPKVFQLAFIYLVLLFLQDLYSIIITINAASNTYAERTITIKQMLLSPFRGEGAFTGPLMTSLYVLILNCSVLFGLVWAFMNAVCQRSGFFIGLYPTVGVVLIVKWIDWSAVWNMSIVYSVLDGRHKFAALGASEYYSRGNRKRGFQLMLMFFVWWIILRLSCYYMGGQDKWFVLVATSFLSCFGNVMKWAACTAYFYDCKKRAMETKVDAEIEKLVNDNTGSTVCHDV